MPRFLYWHNDWSVVVVGNLWIIGQAFRISYRHMVSRRWQVLLLFAFMAVGYTALFVFVLYVCKPSVFGTDMLQYRYYTAGILLLVVLAASLCLAAASVSVYASRSRDLAIRKMYGGTAAVTVVSVFMESLMILLAALFVSLVAAEWWMPALAGWPDEGSAQRTIAFSRLLAGGAALFVLHILISAMLPVCLLLHWCRIPKVFRNIACAGKNIG